LSLVHKQIKEPKTPPIRGRGNVKKRSTKEGEKKRHLKLQVPSAAGEVQRSKGIAGVKAAFFGQDRMEKSIGGESGLGGRTGFLKTLIRNTSRGQKVGRARASGERMTFFILEEKGSRRRAENG